MTIHMKKRRYSLSLTPANVERFQRVITRMGLPLGTMSLACDDVIRDLAQTFETALDKGSFTTSDMLKLMGQQMELLEADEKEGKNVSDKKRATNTKLKKSL
jgi:hypothetical protein